MKVHMVIKLSATAPVNWLKRQQPVTTLPSSFTCPIAIMIHFMTKLSQIVSSADNRGQTALQQITLHSMEGLAVILQQFY